MDRPQSIGIFPFLFEVGTAAFGVAWNFTQLAPGMGRTLGYMDVYEDRLAQFVVEHTFGDGTLVQTQFVDVDTPSGFFFFQEAYPLRVGYSIFPGCLVGLYWIITR
jgi:hypothetical protein